jgi:dTDP-4-dehydrorhamnose reductase
VIRRPSALIWLIGNKGMLGTELSLVLEQQGLKYTGTDREVDLTNPEAPRRFAANHPVEWIVNCAAYTAVDKAEDDKETCRRLNTDGAANIAKAAAAIGAKLIHLSTDYVFNGKGVEETGSIRPYREEDPADPIGVYGLTTRDGERAVFAEHDACYLIRTAWLYGKYGNNFVATMLRLMKERDEVKVVDDQRGSPTWAYDLASAIAALITRVEGGKAVPAGIYHYTNAGDITWYDFASEIYKQGRERGLLRSDCAVKPCTSADYPAKVTRPAYSVLDTRKIQTALGIPVPRWDESLGAFLQTCAH